MAVEVPVLDGDANHTVNEIRPETYFTEGMNSQFQFGLKRASGVGVNGQDVG